MNLRCATNFTNTFVIFPLFRFIQSRNFETAWTQTLKDAGGIIFGCGLFHPAHILWSIAPENLLAWVCVVEIHERKESPLNRACKVADSLYHRLNLRPGPFLQFNGTDAGGCLDEDPVMSVLLETKHVTARVRF